MPAVLSSEELDELLLAVRCLEGDSFASRATRVIGRQAATLSRALPQAARTIVGTVSERAVRVALGIALQTIDKNSPAKAARGLHKAAAAASGALGGAFGLASLAIELPLSTTILLRSIAEIAREEGEDLRRPDAALACVEVFGLGADDTSEAAIEGGYFAARSALAQSVSEGARFLARRGVVGGTAPAMIRLISQISTRFGVVVSEKLAAQAVPIIGALGGAALNVAFAEHFQTVARGHFIVRRLERRHGEEAVQFEYQRLRHQL
ncbi:MAG: EcsC family protein [Hyphomicrobiales bacterium]|nr:EcsC family protein [Hyphomicrobiales bacterium]